MITSKHLSRLLPAAVSAILIMACNSGSESGSASGSGSATANMPSEVTLRLTGEKGQKVTYDVSMEVAADVSGMEIPPGPEGEPMRDMLKGEHKANATGKSEVEITEVKDGNITLTTTLVAVDAKGTGMMEGMVQTLEEDKGKPRTITYDSRNRKVKGEEDAAASNPIQFTFPENPIKVGDTWEDEVDILDSKLKLKFKVDGFEKMNGADAVKISAEITDQQATVTFNEPMTMWYDIKNGQPIKITGNFSSKAQGGISMSIKLHTQRK
jgi:hypothetical protein